jgi:hypothetical protein
MEELEGSVAVAVELICVDCEMNAKHFGMMVKDQIGMDLIGESFIHEN